MAILDYKSFLAVPFPPPSPPPSPSPPLVRTWRGVRGKQQLSLAEAGGQHPGNGMRDPCH